MDVETSAMQAKTPWTQYIGYLEDGRSFLLYRTPNNYVVFPKRVLAGRASEFLTFARDNVVPYNYRNPISAATAGVSGKA